MVYIGQLKNDQIFTDSVLVNILCKIRHSNKMNIMQGMLRMSGHPNKSLKSKIYICFDHQFSINHNWNQLLNKLCKFDRLRHIP